MKRVAHPLVVCTGICVLDLILTLEETPRSGTKHFATSATESVGGPGATAAATVARLGGRARFVSRSGTDARSGILEKALRDMGVDTAFERLPGPVSPVSAILVTRDGERTIINHTDPILFETGPATASFDGAAVTLADVRWSSAAVAAMEHATTHGLPGVLDLDATPAPNLAAVRPAIEGASHVIASRGGVAAVTGTEDLRIGFRRLSAMAPGWVAVTDGASGVVWDGGHLPAIDVEVVDTLGAGDVFHGAFALALAEGRSEEASLRFASAAGALKCTKTGGWAAIPDRVSVERLMEERWS